MKCGEGKWLSQGYVVSKWMSWNLGPSDSKAPKH